ncbi:TPA: T6SS effector BTH_I2691 family protein [Proteus mirabilis]
MSCNFCERRGVAILPVRSAITKNDVNAPKLPNEFDVDITARGEINYTTRLLRKGYLHVFDEKRRAWTDYIVTEEGYYWKINDDHVSKIPTLRQKPCAEKPDELAKSSFISLPLALNPNDNGRFWFSWSQYAWTDNVKKIYSQIMGVREKTMICFDLKQWLNEKKADQTVPFTQLRQVVAEYYETKISPSNFDFYSSPWLEKTESEANYLLHSALHLECAPLKPESSRAAIIHLQDPTAISQDLSQLILQSHDDFLATCRKNSKLNDEKSNDFDRKLSTFSNLSLAEYNVKENNKIQQFLAAEEQELRSYGDDEHFVFPSIAKKRANKIRENVEKNYAVWGESEWKRYLPHMNEQHLEQFKTDFDEQKKEYEEKYENPLFDMYYATIKHSFFINYFIYNFDINDKLSGGNYTDTLSSCLIGSQLSASCADYIETQLNGNFIDKNNIFMRAFIFNQDDAATFYQEHIPQSTDNLKLYSLPWGNLFSFYSSFINNIGKSINFNDKINTLTYVLSGPIIRILKKSSLYKTAKLPILLAITENSPLLHMAQKDTKINLSKLLTKRIVSETLNLQGMKPSDKINIQKIYNNAIENQVNEKGIINIVMDEINIKRAQGADFQGNGVLNSNVLLKENMYYKFTGKTPTEIVQIAKEVTDNVTTSNKINNFYLKQKLSVTASTGGIVAILFQLAGIACMIEQEKSWLGGINTRGEQRLLASWIGVTGSIFEFSLSTLNTAWAKGRLNEVAWFKLSSIGAKTISVVGIAIIAYLDYLDYKKELQKGNILLAKLYYTSSFLGLLLIISITIFSRFPIIGIFISLVYIGVAFYIENYKPNELMLWINKTNYFGKNNEGCFTSEKEELKAFTNLWNHGNEEN